MDEQRETILQNAERAGDIETRAKEMYARETRAMTGHEWNWDEASDEVKNKYRNIARVMLDPEL